MMNSYSIKVDSPDGTMFVVIGERNNRPAHVQIFVGKSGSNLIAYNYAIASLINFAFETGQTIEKVIELLSNITSDKTSYQKNIPIRSGVDAIIYAFMTYKKEKYAEMLTRTR